MYLGRSGFWRHGFGSLVLGPWGCGMGNLGNGRLADVLVLVTE